MEQWMHASYILFDCQVKKNYNVENDPAFSAQMTINLDFGLYIINHNYYNTSRKSNSGWSPQASR